MAMPNAKMIINLGKDPEICARIMGGHASGKRSSRTVIHKGRQITVSIEARDSRALLASMQGVMKQLVILDNASGMLAVKTGKKTAKV